MKMIVGLGNPGLKYRDTKHNIGFIALDEWANQHGGTFTSSKFEAMVLEERIGTEKVLFVKPMTYMNESGRAVRALLDFFKIDLADLLVLYDDMDLPPGKIRLRTKGSAGGHNGVKSLIHHLGTETFNRIRIGVGRPGPNWTVIDHVLSPFPERDHAEMLHAVKESVAAVDDFIEREDFSLTMNTFNRKN